MKYSYASIWARILAFATDYIIIGGYIIVLLGIGAIVKIASPAVSNTLFANPISGQIIGFFVVTLPVTLYFASLESSARQATWGKRKRGLRVIRSNGAKLSKTRALGRTLLKFIPWELAHTCIWQVSFAGQESSPLIYVGFASVWVLVGVNIISLLLSKSHQTLYDQLTDSFVVVS